MKHDTLVFKGHYWVQKKKDCYESSNDIIFFTDETSSYSYIDIQDGKLALSTPNCYQDGGTAYYRRVGGAE